MLDGDAEARHQVDEAVLTKKAVTGATSANGGSSARAAGMTPRLRWKKSFSRCVARKR